jgi:hypothetical protein
MILFIGGSLGHLTLREFVIQRHEPFGVRQYAAYS